MEQILSVGAGARAVITHYFTEYSTIIQLINNVIKSNGSLFKHNCKQHNRLYQMCINLISLQVQVTGCDS